MKNNKKTFIKLIIILILIISFLKIFFLKELSNIKINDDFLFVKLLFNKNSNNNSNILQNNYKDDKEYKFNVKYKNIDFKNINLLETINKEKLVNEKIAPGTNGKFNILLDSNKFFKYKIEFNSINEKPKNLKFEAIKDQKIIGKSYTLEELSNKLTGYINKNEKVNITINWNWDFENKEDSNETDIQDTKDSENIKNYKFNISVIGENS